MVSELFLLISLDVARLSPDIGSCAKEILNQLVSSFLSLAILNSA
jgi:hypothetical protein